MWYGSDVGLWQCVVVGVFVEFGGIDVGWEGQVWYYFFVLGVVVIDVEELGDGQFDLVEVLGFVVWLVVEVDDVLYGVFVEVGFIDYQVMVVVLDGIGEDF